jgi:hypothetical protein
MPNGPSATDRMHPCFEGAERSDHALASSLEPAKDSAEYATAALGVPS